MWCKFCRHQLPKVLRPCQFLTILTSKSLSHAGVVQILSHLGPQILRARPFLGPDFSSRRSHKTIEKHSISRTSYPPNPHVSHLCYITSARSHLLIDRSSAATFSIVGSYIPKLPLIRVIESFLVVGLFTQWKSWTSILVNHPSCFEWRINKSSKPPSRYIIILK